MSSLVTSAQASYRTPELYGVNDPIWVSPCLQHQRSAMDHLSTVPLDLLQASIDCAHILCETRSRFRLTNVYMY